MRQEVQVYVTIKLKGLSQRFEESDEGDRQIRCLQHNPEKTKTRCSPEVDAVIPTFQNITTDVRVMTFHLLFVVLCR